MQSAYIGFFLLEFIKNINIIRNLKKVLAFIKFLLYNESRLNHGNPMGI